MKKKKLTEISKLELPLEKLVQQFTDPKIQGKENLLYNLDFTDIAIQGKGHEQLSKYIVPFLHTFNRIDDQEIKSKAFYIFIELLKTYQPPPRGTSEADHLRATYGFDEYPRVEMFIGQQFAELFAQKHKGMMAVDLPNWDDLTLIEKALSNWGAFEVTPRMIHDAKEAALKFLIAGGFSEAELFIPLMVLSHDRNSTLASPARDRFKKFHIDFEDPQTVEDLWSTLWDIAKKNNKWGTGVSRNAVEILAKTKVRVSDEILQFILNSFKESSFVLDQKIAALTLLKSVLKYNRGKVDVQFVNQMLQLLEENIRGMGWPSASLHTTEAIKFRESIYKMLASLLHEKPNAQNSLGYMMFLFDSMKQDVQMKVCLQDALSEVLTVIPKFDKDQRDKIKEMIFDSLVDEELDQSCKYVAIRYAARVAPFDDAEGRMLCILGCHERNRSDVIDEAKRGLHPHWHWLVNSTVYDNPPSATNFLFPTFDKMMGVVQKTENMLKERHLGKSWREFSSNVYAGIVKFLEQTLVMQAAIQLNNPTVLVIDESWDSRLDAAITMDKSVRVCVRNYIAGLVKNEENLKAMIDYIEYTFAGVNSMDNKDVDDAWIRMISQCPAVVVESQSGVVQDLVKLLDSNAHATRETAAQGLGIVGTSDAVTDESISQLVSQLNNELNFTERLKANETSGRLLALGFVISRVVLRGKNIDDIQNVIETITSKIDDSNKEFSNTAIDSIFQLAMAGALEVDDELKEKLTKAAKKESERGILALGALSMCDDNKREDYVERVMNIYDSRQVEFIFASGEALSIAACGWESTVTDRVLDIQGIEPHTGSATTTTALDTALSKCIESCKSTQPKLRKFACLWLLSLVQYCGHLTEIKSSLTKLHANFMKFLSSDDDIMQESASRGLGIIYEMGDNNLKNDLVRGLMQNMTADKKVNAGTVSEDTELFAPGQLNTGDGSVSTYKDILNLASEVGDPSLVYHFMSLAAHSSLWASRRGAAFGLGTIMSKANMDQVFSEDSKMAKNLIPKLYRYRFDPNTGVRQSMRGIWDTLVSDKSKTIKDHFDLILDELLKGMNNTEWRVREASCSGLSDLLQGQRVERYQDRLEDIWKITFKRVDDIKDSVRKAAMLLAKGLTNTMVRQVDVDNGASERIANTILKEMIPFLLGINGLQSDAQEVSKFALDALMQLCKKGGRALKPYVPMLMEELLELVSTLEPQAMNYLAMNADKYGLTADVIDSSRAQSLQSSPIMETIEQMVDILDDSMMKDISERLVKVVKKGVGLPSKLGASRVLVLLVMRRLHQIAPFADKILKACQTQLNSINDTVCQSYASTAGYLCRIASNEAVIEYEKSLEPLYFDSDNTERPRLIVAYALHAVAAHSSDKFDAVASAFLPLIFIGKHDADKQVKEKFEQTWNDNTGGSGAVKLYLHEIIKLCSEQLANNQQWSMRQVAASTIADASSVIDDKTSKETMIELFKTLIFACKGKSWLGKEKILDALVKLAVRAKGTLTSDGELFNTMNELVINEAKRRNKEYQAKALLSLGKYTQELPQQELYTALFDNSKSHLNPEEEEVDEDGDITIANSTANIAREEQRNEILTSVILSYQSKDINDNQLSSDVLSRICQLSSDTLTSETNPNARIPVTWRTKSSVMTAIYAIVERVPKDQADLMQQVWKVVLERCAVDMNHERVRTEAVRLGIQLDTKLRMDVKQDLMKLKENEKSTVVIAEINKGL